MEQRSGDSYEKISFILSKKFFSFLSGCGLKLGELLNLSSIAFSSFCRKTIRLFLVQFKVDVKDRDYQCWKRNPLSVELRNHAVFRQKLDYIYWNPIKSGMCKLPEDYKYSSALFYETDVDNWSFLEHYRD